MQMNALFLMLHDVQAIFSSEYALCVLRTMQNRIVAT